MFVGVCVVSVCARARARARACVCVFVCLYTHMCVRVCDCLMVTIGRLKGESCVFSSALVSVCVCVCVFIQMCLCYQTCLSLCLYLFVCEWVCANVCKCVCPPNSDHRQIKGWIVDPSTKWALPLQWDFVAMFSALQKPQDAPSTSQRPYCKSGSALNAPFCTTFADYLEHILVLCAVRTVPILLTSKAKSSNNRG